MKTKMLFLVAGLLIASTRMALSADAINEALQKGLLEEEANHNLDAAIQAYESVINQYDDQRKVAATAVFRLAECYRKQGKTNEALIHYGRVVTDFGDQTELSRLASRYVAPRSAASREPDFRGRPFHQLINYTEFEKLLTADRITSGVIHYPAGGGGLLDISGTYAERSPDGKVSDVPFQLKVPRFDYIERRLLETGKFRTLESPSDSAAWQKELLQQELALVETQLASKQKLTAVGLAGSDDLIPFQREVLSLKRQIAAAENPRPDLLRSVQLPADDGGSSELATDEETKEIQRLKEVIRNSPDLINAKGERGYTPLHNAANRGQLAVARFLLENGADVDARNNGGASALHLAASLGYKAMAELLLAKGAAINGKDVQGRAPLHTAAANGFVALGKTLIGRQADVNAKDENNATPLHWAVENGFKDTVALLLANKADPNISGSQPVDGPGRLPSGRPLHILGGPPLHIAVRRGQSEDEGIVELLLKGGALVNAKDPFGSTPLQLAVQSGNKRIVEVLLSNGADVNTQAEWDSSYTPLHWAIRPGNTDMIESLLAHKADVNARSKEGFAPLHLAVMNTDKTIVELILAGGADVDAQDASGHTPLHWASAPGHKDMVESLLNHKADVNAKDEAGDTPLHAAVSNGDKTIVELLLARGADVNARNNAGKTALDLTKPLPPGISAPGIDPAAYGGAQQAAPPDEIAKLLRKHGAKE